MKKGYHCQILGLYLFEKQTIKFSIEINLLLYRDKNYGLLFIIIKTLVSSKPRNDFGRNG